MKVIPEIKKRTQNFFSSIRPKNIIVALACILLLSIPSILALHLILKDSSDTSIQSYKVILCDSDKNLIAEESISPNPEKSKSIAEIFYKIFSESVKTDEAPFSAEVGIPIYVSTIHNGIRSEYTCYFSSIDGSSYYVDSAGSIFLIEHETAAAFLSTNHAESLYRKSTPPKLRTNTDATVIPTAVSWYYQLYDDSYLESLNCETTSEVLSYDFSGVIDIKFDNSPDSCLVRVFENGSLIYEGGYEELSKITVKQDAALRISVQAKWDEKKNALYHGSVSYSFDAKIQNRASFFLSGDALKENTFLMLTCTNADDPSKIAFKSDSAFTPKFYTDGKYVRALLLYPCDLNDEFNFSVTYGASTQSFSVSLLTETNIEKYTLNDNSPQVAFALSNKSLANIGSTVSGTLPKNNGTVYFRGNILSPQDHGYTLEYTFGTKILLSDESAEMTAYGNAYTAEKDGKSVKALVSGTVSAVGHSSELGNYVAVDSGAGILLWYCHLSDVDASVGATVAVGDTVGKSGASPIFNGYGFLLLCTAEGKFIDPSAIILK